MKKHACSNRIGFTLIELLVVMAIIAVLAALLMPVLNRTKSKMQRKKAQADIADIVLAIHAYESAYSRFPVSVAARKSASTYGEDFTYGTMFKQDDGSNLPLINPGNLVADNSELMAILLDLESHPNGSPTVNKGHSLNPQRTKFLEAKSASDTNSPGLGPDGVYRDPWGGVYIISLDLNGDGTTRDAFYRQPAISQDPADPTRGLNGLIKKTDPQGNALFEINAGVAAWSSGPDKRVNWQQKADQGDNKNNVLSWSSN